jgi:hypothetical protein
MAKMVITQAPSAQFTLSCSCCGEAFDVVSYNYLRNAYLIYRSCPYCWADFAGIINNTDKGFDDSYVTGEPD